jgi:glycosyl transferase family 25
MKSEYFQIPVFVVSMTNAVDRREAISKQLGGHKGCWRFFDAIVPGETAGTSWSLDAGARSAKVLGRYMTRGEFGCALSHLQVYSAIANGKHDAAIVLEDDALVSGDLFQICEAVINAARFDVLLLGYSKVNAHDQCLRNLTEPMLKIAQVFGRDVGLAYRERRSGTVGYLITKEGARKLQRIQGDVVTVADDWPYFRQKGLDIRHARPAVILEDFFSTESSIDKDRVLVEKNWSRKFQTLRQFCKVVRGFIWRIHLRLSQSVRD